MSSESNTEVGMWETWWSGLAVIGIVGFVVGFASVGVSSIWGSDFGIKISATACGIAAVCIIFGFWFAEACKIRRERLKAEGRTPSKTANPGDVNEQ